MKEVCIFNYASGAAVYGIGTYIREYIYCLKKIGCKIILVELGTDEKKTGFHVKEQGTVRTIHIPQITKRDMDRYDKGVIRLIRLYIEDSPELIFHFQYRISSGILDSLKQYFPQSKLIYTIHYLGWKSEFNGDVKRFNKIIRKQADEKIKTKYGNLIENFKNTKTFFEKLDRIVCLSDDTLNVIQQQYGFTQNVWLIPNGLKGKSRYVSKEQKLKWREKFHISSDEKILLFVGRIDSFKGIGQVISCFGDVVKEYPDCRLVVIGSGDINGMANKCDNVWTKVTFTGRLDKKTLYQWYQIADIALCPSLFEECSYVGIEMLMHGLPIITSDGNGVKNMFHEGVNAKVARIENHSRKSQLEKNLKEVILECLNSDITESKLKKGAKMSYQSKYSIDRMQEAYTRLLNSF